MTLDETHIYCGNNNYLFRFRKDGSEFEILYEEFQLVRSMVTGDDQVFVMDDPPGSAAPDILGFTRGSSVVGYGKSPEWGGQLVIRRPNPV